MSRAVTDNGDTQTQIIGFRYFLYCNVKVMANPGDEFGAQQTGVSCFISNFANSGPSKTLIVEGASGMFSRCGR